MEKTKKLTTKKLILILAAIALVSGGALAILAYGHNRVKQVASEKKYEYTNPDEIKAEPDAGFVIDGVLDEKKYQDCDWLYLHNANGGSGVDIAMTSYYGNNGMYFVYDVTEDTPIYVNLERRSYMNSGIEMYLALNGVTSMKSNSVFEIDLLPTGDMNFKQRTGRGNWVNVASTDDIMSYLGATTKGGPVNTEECTGYYLELFIPWAYMDKLGMNASKMKEDFVYINPAHITSYNLTGTNSDEDRYWYSFATQLGGDGWGNITQYFRFGERGAIGTVPVELVEGNHYSITGSKSVVPGMMATVTITPEEGYALNSILVNGEEYIKKVSYNEDGSVTLSVRGAKKGLKISASAEAVTVGNNKLSGVIKVNKLSGDNLNGVSASYTGPTGEKPLTFDGKGNFELNDLKQGYYTIKVEKQGYQPITRGIYLNRDIETELVLEYQMFQAEGGQNWILDDQNDGLLSRFGGSGKLLTVDKYNKFAIEGNFKYDQELAKVSDGDTYLQQRSGIRMKFSNEKYWRVDVLFDNGTYKVQYAKQGENSVFEWKTIHTMTEDEIAQYLSEDGIKLSILRDGKVANIYLGDQLLRIEELPDEYKNLSAQIGFEAWVGNFEVEDMEYNISSNLKYDIANYYFKSAGAWDIRRQYEGIVSLPGGGDNKIAFSEKYTDLDLTIKVRDYDDLNKTHSRTDVLFEFENDAHVSFGITYHEASDSYRIQSLNFRNDDGKQIYNRWTSHGTLTEEETALYLGDGVDFRLVRIGTELTLYIGDRQVKVCDFTNNNRGVTADMKATVYLRHFDDAGVDVDIPFSINKTFDFVTITSVEGTHGKVVGQKKQYLVGDTVILSGEGKEGYYCTSMKVNGKDVTLKHDGTYTFKATEKNYTLEGTFAERIFLDNNKWNLLKQNEGIVSLLDGGDNKVEFYKQYTDMDLTVTARDYADSENTYARTDIQFEFENGAHVSFGITYHEASGTYRIQSLNLRNDDGKQIYNRWTSYGTLTKDEEALYLTDGVDFRLVRIGTELALYIGDRFVKVCDFTNNDSGVTADMKATVYIRHFDDAGVDVDIPFRVNKTFDFVTITSVEGTHGKVVGQKKQFLVGETVILSGNGKEGYYCTSMKVNGKDVKLDHNGTYTFKATEKNYTVEGTFAERIFTDNDAWDQTEQYNGVVSFLANNGTANALMSYKTTYKNVDVTLKNVKEQGTEETGSRTEVRIKANISHEFGITKKTDGCYVTYEGGPWKKLSDAVEQKYMNGEGVDFRVIREGTIVYVYVDNAYIAKLDLAGKDTIEADTPVQLGIVVNDKVVDKTVRIPFAISEELQKATLDIKTSAYGTVAADNMNVFAGTKVVLTATPKSGCDCIGLKVNGQDVTDELVAGTGGIRTYTFTATESKYAVEAEFAQRIFTANNAWDQTEQYDGVVSFLANNGATNALVSSKTTYTNVDVTLKNVKEQGTEGTGSRTEVRIRINSTNHEFGITKTADGCYVTYQGGTWKKLSDEVKQKYMNGEGVDFRVIRDGTNVYIYVDNAYIATLNLAGKDENIKADTPAQLGIVVRNKVVDKTVRIPFTISEEVNRIFNTTTSWDVTNQYVGVISLNKDVVSNKIQFNKQYADMDLTLKVKNHSAAGKTTARTEVSFEFSNKAHVTFGVQYDSAKGKYCVASYNAYADDKSGYTPIYNRGTIHGHLTDAETTLYLEEEIDFRIVRVGTDVALYIGDRLVKVCDLTNNNSGVTAGMKATMHLRCLEYDGNGADIPFSITEVATFDLTQSASILRQAWRRLLSFIGA